MKGKTMIVALLCAVIGTAALLSLTACGETKQDTDKNTSSATIQVDKKEEENTQTPNLWTEQKTLQDAAKAIGFSLSAPETIKGYPEVSVQTMEKAIIQIMYRNDADSITIRKGTGTEDISGDYNVYQESKEVIVGKYTVTESGNDGTVSLATWNDGTYAYALSTPGMDAEAVAALIAQIQ